MAQVRSTSQATCTPCFLGLTFWSLLPRGSCVLFLHLHEPLNIKHFLWADFKSLSGCLYYIDSPAETHFFFKLGIYRVKKHIAEDSGQSVVPPLQRDPPGSISNPRVAKHIKRVSIFLRAKAIPKHPVWSSPYPPLQARVKIKNTTGILIYNSYRGINYLTLKLFPLNDIIHSTFFWTYTRNQRSWQAFFF